MSTPTSNLRLVHRTFTSKVQLRQAKGSTLTRPLATVESITGVGVDVGGETPTGSSSLLRTASFNGVTCTVVPIIALMGDIVLQAANAPTPELVPLYCLESLPLAAWNGRPIVPLHPNDGQQYISANDPVTLDKYGFGLTFNAAISNGALQLDGYLNPIRAAVVGPLANDVLARLATDELIEVSVGVSVLVSDEVGTIKSISGEDVSYSAIWQQLLYVDHVAMLPAGVEGACSVNVGGCGAPRVNTKGNTNGNNNATITGGGSIMAEIIDASAPVLEVAAADPPEIWYSNIRELLEAALYDYFKAQSTTQPPMPSVEPDVDDLYIWVKAFSNLRVVYERGPGPSYQQYYSLDSTGKVILKGEEVEVVREEDYRPASKPPVKGIMNRIRDLLRSLKGARHSAGDQVLTQMIHDCSQDLGAACPVDEKDQATTGDNTDYMKPMEAATGDPPDSPIPAPCSCKGGSKAMAMSKQDKTALVTKILSAPGSTFKEDQRAVLEATDEAVLTALAAGGTVIDPSGDKPKEATATQVVAQASATPSTALAAPAPLTPDQWWAQAPPEMANIRTLAARAAESDKQEKETLVRALSTAQEAFTEPQLTAMDLANLRSLASLTGLFLPRFDFSGAAGALTRDAAGSQQDKETQAYLNPPKPFDQMRAAKAGGSKVSNTNPNNTSATTGAN